ncbi:MAG: dicarboxylate/amino acid:cation symporter, partial [Butyricicoccus sp.]
MKKLRNSLPFQLLLGVIVGILVGQAANVSVMHVVVTVKYVLGQLINFCVP